MTPTSSPIELRAAGTAREEGTGSSTDSALFVIWSKGRHVEDRVVADLDDRFTLLKLYEVAWTPGRVVQNYRRFYSDLPVRGVYHTHGKGRGPFLAAVVLDCSPKVTECMTSRGLRALNARFLDAKLQYRRWAGELTIHSTETPFETERDLTMLFGVDPGRMERLMGEPRPREIERVERDLTGDGGWASEADLFAVLNRSVSYVVTGAPGVPPAEDVLGLRHVNLLTDDYLTLHAVLGARPRLPRPHGGPFRIRVADRWVDVRLRFVGDRFYDPALAEHLLTSRRSVGDGPFRLPDREDFRALAYDRFVHGRAVDRREYRQLADLAAELDIADWPADPAPTSRRVSPVLARWLTERDSAAMEPLDPSVGFDDSMAAGIPERVREGNRWLPRRISWLVERMRHALAGSFWLAWDQILFRVPGIRKMKRISAKGARHGLRHALGSRGLFAVKRAVLLLRGLLFYGRRYRCPCCGWSLRGFVGERGVLSSNHDGFCPRCNAKARHRRLWLYLQEQTDLLRAEARVLEIAPWWAISRRLLQAKNVSYIGLDIARRGPHVTIVGDAADVPLAADCMDVALCIHTLEHIEEDRRAMRELHRVLKPGGWCVVSVPLNLDSPTHEDPAVTDPEDRAREFGERTHVRWYGLDIEDRLTAAGFDVQLDRADRIPLEMRQRFGLRDDENLFLCRKVRRAT